MAQSPPDLKRFDVTVRRLAPAKGLASVTDFVLPVYSPGEEHTVTYQAASLSLVLEGVLVVAVLVVAVMDTRLPSELIAFRLAPGRVLIALLWVGGV